MKRAVLHGQGIVEAQALAELVEVLRLDVHGQEEKHGVAAEPHEEEDGGQREENDEEGLAEAREEVRAHQASRSLK